ncbi:MAG: HIT domain-containing protein [Phycisphaeraceae bacterium]|nr:MAG: HIT domain-containing protein [Phycisphaeraceae bacterium]
MPNQPTDPSMGPSSLPAPWRLDYLERLDKEEKQGKVPQPGSGSFLLDYWLAPERDVQNHVIVRTDQGMILLNAYPYAAGHVLVALGDPRPSLLDYGPDQRRALWELVVAATAMVERTLEPQGINTGINQGRAAGAGIPQHLHVHLVPRWGGDTNFITTIGQVRVIPASLDAMAARYRAVWQRMIASGFTI